MRAYLIEKRGLTAEIIKTNILIIDAQRVEQVEDGFRHHRRTSSEAAIHDFVTSVTRVMVALPPLSIVNIHFVPWFPLDTYFPQRGPHFKGYLCALSHEKTTHGLLHRTKQQQPSETCGNRVG